jgi:hypothetical protein
MCRSIIRAPLEKLTPMVGEKTSRSRRGASTPGPMHCGPAAPVIAISPVNSASSCSVTSSPTAGLSAVMDFGARYLRFPIARERIVAGRTIS